MTRSTTRSGRLPAAEKEARRQEMLRAAAEVFAEGGVETATMDQIAKRANASKETLYAWFGNREAIVGELIRQNADATVAGLATALAAPPTDEARLRRTLTSFATGLLRLLTGPDSVGLNRAAMGSPHLAELLLSSGRHRIGPIVEDHLGAAGRAGLLVITDAGEAFRTLYGLIVRDTQIRVLLGEAPPSDAAIKRDARRAVDAFLRLTRTTPRS